MIKRVNKEELIIQNNQLAFQIQENEKRAAELIIANKELAFQNQEKEKRAAELVIANKELAFQNQEKEKRAAELIIANKELAFQNEEKEKKAEQLVKINSELNSAKEYQKAYINGLQEIMFITSHRVRQPVTNILGISNQLDQTSNSQQEVKDCIEFIKQSALTLDTFTKELTIFISNLKQKGKELNVDDLNNF